MHRRTFLVRVIQSIHALMGATLAFVVGGAAMAPSFARRPSTWLPAADVSDVQDDTPYPTALRVTRSDGATDIVERRMVYIVRSSDGTVRALDSTCTHLGCRTRFNSESGLIECPCHGGVYDPRGNVVSGPPPSPLRSLRARVDNDHIFVEL
jgi:succinate dehydrogenase / fumarate reductase iron-sulfur subunit